MSPSSWKTILLPPLCALALYLLITYVLLPLYHRYVRTWGSRYTPLSNSNNNNHQSSSDAAAHLFDEFRTRVSDLLGRARSDSLNGEVGRYLGDEELEEGVYGGSAGGSDRGRRDRGGSTGSGGEGDGTEESGRRLGRELETGFMDDSSDEEEGERRRVRGVLGLRGG